MTDQTLDPVRLSALPIADHFQAIIDAAIVDGVPPSALVDLHAGDAGLGLRLKRYTWDEFDEERANADAKPGRNVLVLRFAGVRNHQAQRVILKAREPEQPAPLPMLAPPITADQKPASYGPEALVTLIVSMMQQQSEQTRAQMSQQQQMNMLLMERVLAKSDTPKERTILEQMIELDDMLDRRASRREGDGGAIIEQLAPVLTAIASTLQQAKPPAAKTPTPPAPQLPPASPAAEPEQPAEASADAADLIRTLGAILVAGAAQEQPDHHAYANVALDMIEAAGFDPVQVLAAIPEGSLIVTISESHPTIPPDFVLAVEAAMREAITDDTPPPALPITPPTTRKPKKPSKKDPAHG